MLTCWLADCTCWIFQVSCRGLVEPYQRYRSSKVDGYRDSAHLDIIYRPGRARGNSLRHDHHGLQRRTPEDLFAAPHAESWLYEGERRHTDLEIVWKCGEKYIVLTQLWTAQTCACTYSAYWHVQTHMEMQMLAHTTRVWIYVHT